MGVRKQYSFHEVVSIRERAAKGEPLQNIANEFGVTLTAMSRLVQGETYAELPGPRTIPKPGRRSKEELAAERARLAAQTDALAEELRELRPAVE